MTKLKTQMLKLKVAKFIDAVNFLELAKKEIERYDKTGNYYYLHQAGNKLYNAHIYLIELIKGQEVISNRQVIELGRTIAKRNKLFNKIRFNVLAFHKWFYEGTEDEREAKNRMQQTIKDMEKLLNKLYIPLKGEMDDLAK